jgi:predicted dehydrogenase
MRIAVIGPGGIARAHLNALKDEPNVEIVGHVARSLENAQAAADEWGGKAYDRCQQLLDEQTPDAVWICVPPDAHGPLELALIERGISFLVEKPLDADCATAEGIAEAVERSGLPAAVGYHMRGFDTLPRVVEVLREHPARMVVGQWLTITPPPAWWSDPQRGGGQMVEQATHLIDLARYLVGEGKVVASLASESYGNPGVPGASAALIRYQSGAIGSFSATHLLPRSTQVSLTLVCERLRVEITAKRVLIDRGGDDIEEIPVQQDPYAVENRAFLQALRTGDRSHILCSYAEGLKSHQLACRIRALAEQG